MLSLSSIALFAYALSLVVFAVCLMKAPLGWQDERGFHFGLAPVMLARRRPAQSLRIRHSF